jgi:hypothetical protein
VHMTKSIKKVTKNHILKKIWWIFIIFLYKNIFAYIFWFNNQFIKSMRTWSIFQEPP